MPVRGVLFARAIQASVMMECDRRRRRSAVQRTYDPSDVASLQAYSIVEAEQSSASGGAN